MTLKDIRDKLSRMFAQDRSLEEREVSHILIEDTQGIIHEDYLLKDDDSELEDEEDYAWDDSSEDDDYDYEEDDDDDDKENWLLEDDDKENWLLEDDSDLEESY